MGLSDLKIKGAKPGDKSYKISDSGGLYILIETTGGKLWRYDYRFEGKRKTLALGQYPDISLQEARTVHSEARNQLAKGIDPAALKKAQKAAGKERNTNSLEAIAYEWIERWKIDKTESHYTKVLSLLKRDVFPYIGNRPVSGITAPDVLNVLRRVEERGAVSTAHKIKSIISMIMRYAISTTRADRDPCPDLRGALPPRRIGHLASITNPEAVGELLRSIDAYKGTPVVRAALRFAPMIFVRPSELRHAKWADIDLDRAEWTYTVSKTKTDHLVPLSSQVLELLRDLQLLTGGGEYVFPGMRYGQPISEMTINRALQAMGYDTKTEITGHGFRAMARTLLAERLGSPPEIIELQLAHAVPDPNKGAYNRVRFIDDRRRMMQTWSDYLTELKKPKSGKAVQKVV
jgi:integrase